MTLLQNLSVIQLQTDELRTLIMQPFGTSYTKAINKQQNRTGPLFQGPFRGKLVDSDSYLKHLTRYIHLNPVNAGYVSTPAAWIYSSYRDYLGLRNGTLPKPDVVLTQFPSRAAYQAFVEEEHSILPPDFERWLAEFAEGLQ